MRHKKQQQQQFKRAAMKMKMDFLKRSYPGWHIHYTEATSRPEFYQSDSP